MGIDWGGDQVSILVVDDHSLFRQSLRFMLEHEGRFRVVGEASDGLRAIAAARELVPEVILMDIRMPSCSGLEALKQIQRELPAVSVIMLTISEDDEDLFAAIKAGARGYLLKSIESDELVRAVESVAAGGAVISPVMARKLIAEFAAAEADQSLDAEISASPLTTREQQILELVGKGRDNKEIADSLCITVSTMKTHMRNIMAKLHIHNRAQAVAYALRTRPSARRKARLAQATPTR